MSVAAAFELLTVLDSPLTPIQAPELMKYRDEVEEATKSMTGGGCTSCQKRAIVAKLAEIQTRMQDEISKNEDLKALIPTLLASAKLSTQ